MLKALLKLAGAALLVLVLFALAISFYRKIKSQVEAAPLYNYYHNTNR